MEAQYADRFPQVYDRYWLPYPRRIGAALRELHQKLAPDAERRMLDVGCGTGIVTAAFQQDGYEVTGVDISAAMLARARERLGAAATLIQADASDFQLEQRFPLAVSTYDIPNHIGDLDRIRSYLKCVYAAVSPGGWFVFDVATLTGLRSINNAQVRETEDAILLYRGALDEAAGRGIYRISGVTRAPDGRYDRFQVTITNYVVPIDRLLDLVREVGWQEPYLATTSDLTTPLVDVDTALAEQPRVFFICRHP